MTKLNKEEAKLPKPSVVNISQVYTVDRAELTDKIGTLSEKRVDQIVEGLKLLLEPRDVDFL